MASNCRRGRFLILSSCILLSSKCTTRSNAFTPSNVLYRGSMSYKLDPKQFSSIEPKPTLPHIVNNCGRSLPLLQMSSASPPAMLSSSSSSSSGNILSSISQTVQLFSKSTMSSSTDVLSTITNVASSTPPLAYFFALLSAGFGIPVSEDALCIFAGTILPTLAHDRHHQIKLVLCLYLGVVISDAVTFWIGRALRLGLLEPLRERLQLDTKMITTKWKTTPSSVMTTTVTTSTGVELNDNNVTEGVDPGPDVRSENVSLSSTKSDRDIVITPHVNKVSDMPRDEQQLVGSTALEGMVVKTKERIRKRDRIRAKIENAGDYIGFVIRFSVGMRGPLMLLTGFTGRVAFSKFIAGAVVGGLFSLPLQLLLGYSMRNNPGAVIGAVASISTFVVALPAILGLVSSIAVLWNKK